MAQVGDLKKVLSQLYEAKSRDTGHIRMIVIGRLLKHRQLFFQPGQSGPELLMKYPHALDDEGVLEAQSFARAMLATLLTMRDTQKSKQWPKDFWRRNFDLSPCADVDSADRELIYARQTEKLATKVDVDRIFEIVRQHESDLSSYLEKLRTVVRIDLFKPTRDEVLLGLTARMIRLYSLVIKNPDLWARDIFGIVMRCAVDTAITLKYLGSKGTTEEFDEFVKYSLGREKLLLQQLEELYPGTITIDSKSAEDVRQAVGGAANVEYLDIELRNWTKTPIRELARQVDMSDQYRLVYGPTSSDVHGTWSSLRSSNLIMCRNPLHRFHMRPHDMGPTMHLESVISLHLFNDNYS